MKEIYIKISVVILIGVIFLFSYTSIKIEKKPITKEITKKDIPIMVAVSSDNVVQDVDMDSYLLGVVAGEMPADFEMEALKAQVVASRTFVYQRGLQVDDTTSSQVYLNDAQMREHWGDQYETKKAKIEQAIKETKNEVMTYQGEYISALFFSCSNGYTENSNDYFVEEIPYLISVESPWDQKVAPNYSHEKTFSVEEIKRVFNCNTIDFNIVSYKKSGRVETLLVNDVTYTGREVRELLSLSSSSFTISMSENGYTFTSVGSGHGVGMSQYGAQGMAKEGYLYQDILQYYYTDIEIVNL
jgi:stage II sporulation protein D